MANWRGGKPQRTLAGVKLTKTPDGWYGVVAGVEWFFVKREDGKWGGYTAGHQTGCPVHIALKHIINWIHRHSVEIAEKVASRPAR
jgi:hypothetical protein